MTSDNTEIPTADSAYADLLLRTDAPPGSSWGLFGQDDELGCLNFQTPERLLEAMGSARSGRMVNLDHAINYFDPPTAHFRHPAVHHMFQSHRDQRDDYLDSFYLQSTSQLDGFRHRRHERHGFYNGVRDEDVSPASPRIGIGLWAERGIAGRGVLVDLPRQLGRQLDHEGSEVIEVGIIDDALEKQGTRVRPGDILIVRTGFDGYYRELLQAGRRLADAPRSAGLLQSREILAWLWDRKISLLASDNIAVEALPANARSPFSSEFDGGLMHQELLALLGLPLGELWRLDQLADACAERGAHDFLCIVRPLNLPAGVGSPSNAVAVL